LVLTQLLTKDELPIGVGLIAQAILRRCPGSLEGDLLSAPAIDAFARAKITVEFERLCL
jgi:hypothetical protein